jgi:hypothetical protein
MMYLIAFLLFIIALPILTLLFLTILPYLLVAGMAVVGGGFLLAAFESLQSSHYGMGAICASIGIVPLLVLYRIDWSRFNK